MTTYNDCGNCGAQDLGSIQGVTYHRDSHGNRYAHCPHCDDGLEMDGFHVKQPLEDEEVAA